MRRIIQILKDQGPMLSGELAVCLQNTYGISNESARKIKSRSSSPISKINLFSAFKSSSKNYYQILLAIQSNGGFVSKGVLENYSSAPIENLTRHLRFDLIIKRLIELNFIGIRNKGGRTLCQAHRR